MTPDRSAAAEHALKLLRQISLELAFVDPHAQKPAEELRRLLGELEQAVVAHAPQAIRDLAAAARSRVEVSPGVAATLNTDAIVHLHDWQPRMEEAVLAWSREPEASGQQAQASPTGEPVSSQPVSRQPVSRQPEGTAVRPASPALKTHAAAVTELFSVLPDDADGELVRLFCSESQDLLQDIEQGVLVLEERPEDKETLATVFRAFHTFKGNASVMKLTVIQRLAHELESLLDAARRGAYRLDRRAIDAILAGADAFKRFIDEMAVQIEGTRVGQQISLPVAAVIEDVRGMLSAPQQPAATVKPVAAAAPTAAPATVVPPASVVAAEPVAIAPPQVAPEASPPPVAPPLPAADVEQSVVQPAAARPAAAAASAGAGSAGLIRVDTAKLDGLIDLVGELVIAQSMVTQNSDLQAVASEQLARSLGQLRGISTELQRTALSLRMVPVRGTFQKMARLVRDLSGQVGKEIRLVLEGEETEVDRTLVEELGDPLVHMIRNAADHGIESPTDRVAAGKDPSGTITLRALHKGGMVFLQIQDDGRGLSVSRIRGKAIERGLISAHEQLTDREVLDLIFAPGFSLASTVTDLSGRGVGMDVVRRNIERLRGTIEIDSAEGRGTTFTIGLPLTLAIIEGLLVQVGDQRFVVPTLSVRESFRPLPSMMSVVQGRGEMVSVRGTLVPLLRLANHLHIADAVTDPTQGIVMVLEAGQDCRCVLVDALVGKQEVVIKSLGETFQDQQEFAGAAILGDGRVGLILDTTSLVRLKLKHAEAA
jgi:two-component system, chemotaxis family, sensor kinase CheA